MELDVGVLDANELIGRERRSIALTVHGRAPRSLALRAEVRAEETMVEREARADL
jgi:hypothetical protein